MIEAIIGALVIWLILMPASIWLASRLARWGISPATGTVKVVFAHETRGRDTARSAAHRTANGTDTAIEGREQEDMES